MLKTSFLFLLLTGFLCDPLFSQQIADTSYNPPIPRPAYPAGTGPVLFIDEGHHNFHTKNGRYWAFARLLERDGYTVEAYTGEFMKEKLEKGRILVISNALHETNVENWWLPTPSAFTGAEISLVKRWVEEGGSLFLIADHMPLAGAAKELAAAFGFWFTNGFALDTTSRGPSSFDVKEGTLRENVITRGRDSSETVRQVATFTGQAFQIPADAVPILVFSDRFMNYLPDTAWQFTPLTPRQRIEGWSQGAFKKCGKGRVVVFGEAAMFTAQLAGEQKTRAGMNTDIAKKNYQLLLNIIHWLDGKLD
jgi:hypothetical protein